MSRTEFLKSQEKAKQNFKGVTSAKTRGEGCSCIEGNPCAQECDAQGNSICRSPKDPEKQSKCIKNPMDSALRARSRLGEPLRGG